MDLVFVLASFTVPIVLYILAPRVLARHTNEVKDNHLLLIGSFLFLLSWYLPSPEINGENTAFMTHLIGGGVFSGFFWLYLKRNLNIQLSWRMELVSLYFLVSGLGVINELFELTVVQFGLSDIEADDTWWDLMANTLGAFTFWIGYRLKRHLKNK